MRLSENENGSCKSINIYNSHCRDIPFFISTCTHPYKAWKFIRNMFEKLVSRVWRVKIYVSIWIMCAIGTENSRRGGTWMFKVPIKIRWECKAWRPQWNTWYNGQNDVIHEFPKCMDTGKRGTQIFVSSYNSWLIFHLLLKVLMPGKDFSAIVATGFACRVCILKDVKECVVMVQKST